MTDREIYTLTTKPQVVGKLGETEIRFISEESEEILDTMLENVINLVNTKNGKGESDEVKDELYAQARNMVKLYSDTLGITNFRLNITRDVLFFLEDFIQNGATYDIENVFVGVEARKIFGNVISNIGTDENVIVPLNPTTMTYTYHIISKWSGTGWSKNVEKFIDAVTAYGQISSIVKYYDAKVQQLEDMVVDWVTAFEEGIKVDKK